MEAGRREPIDGGARQRARHKAPKDLLRRVYPARADGYGPSEATGTAPFQGGPSHGPAEGQQRCRPYLAKEDADLVPTGIASQRSDAPHIRDHLSQVLAAAVHFCFPVGTGEERMTSASAVVPVITEIHFSDC